MPATGALVARHRRPPCPSGLTGAQTRARRPRSAHDLAADDRMLRLLQGDVGSGKTLVALLAMASAVEAGRQAALVAPTEILARQHAERLAPLAEPAGLRVALLTGRDRPAERRRSARRARRRGEIDIVVGTHALIQDEVAFRDLGLAVIDEQHRFGVHQRLALGRKGEAVDILVMTATPIPRTLALAAFGDMDVSVLDEKPPGRQPIDTRLVSADRLDEVTDAVARAIGGRRPRLLGLPAGRGIRDASTSPPRRSASTRAARPCSARSASASSTAAWRRRDKDAAMARFAARRHQGAGLDDRDRGRRRRAARDRDGDRARRALRPRAAAPAARPGRPRRARLDLPPRSTRARSARPRRRGSRRCAGPRTASPSPRRTCGCAARARSWARANPGTAGFRIARLDVDADLLAAARDDARLIVERDPRPRPASAAGRCGSLLYLFERDAGVRLLRAG